MKHTNFWNITFQKSQLFGSANNVRPETFKPQMKGSCGFTWEPTENNQADSQCMFDVLWSYVFFGLHSWGDGIWIGILTEEPSAKHKGGRMAAFCKNVGFSKPRKQLS